MKILEFGFSLRSGSFSRIVAEQCKESAPKGVIIEDYNIADIPPFNQDLEQDLPDSVVRFKNAIRTSDALLVILPEYNYSVPGYLKNAIDFASRPYQDNVFAGKPVGVISESTGLLGGARAQYHLRQSFLYLGTKDMKKPEVFITFAGEKIKNGKIVDEATKEYISMYISALVEFTMNANK